MPRQSMHELDVRQYGRGGFFDLLRHSRYPIVHQHDRYWESSCGSTGAPGTSGAISCDWITEIPWRVSTLNPAGASVLRHYIEPFRHQDLLGVSKGGFLVGTYGMENELARFARNFRSLPAVLFDDLPSSNPDVTVRGKRYRGKDYAYAVNTSERIQKCSFQGAELTLQPYEFKSFVDFTPTK